MRARFTYLASLVFILFSCGKDDAVVPVYEPTTISSEISDLFETRGNTDSDTVWVFIQGGPVTQRDYTLEETLPNGDEAYPFITDDLRVYPFQTQHLNMTLATATNFTFENAKVESARSAEIISEVVKHFTSQSKVVYLIGHSYGSFLVNEVLAQYGSIARKTISLNGRLDMDQVVWEGFSEGNEWLFDANGENPFLNSSASNAVEDQNMRKIAAGLGFNRYTDRLANADLSDAIFLTSDNDDLVGDFTQEAIDFLTNQAEGLIILQPNFGHGDVFEPQVFRELHDMIIMDN